MLVSYSWLNEYFGGKLPEPEKLADVLTMNAFEIEGVEEKNSDSIIDVKVLPNRAHDCLSHRGVAREIGTLLDLRPDFPAPKPYGESAKATLEVGLESPLCRRYIGRKISNIKVGESPEWLTKKLEALGQRSINNVVDITNYVMFETGQPMHAFDTAKVSGKISARLAAEGEKLTTLDGKEVELRDTLVIADGEKPLAIAGVKGGTAAEVNEKTSSIILESANFNPGNVRKTSARLNIKTDSSKRFENELSPETAHEAMELATSLVAELAGTSETVVEETVDAYPRARHPYKVGISTHEANRILGTSLSDSDIENILNRTGWEWRKSEPHTQISELARSLAGRPYKLGASVSYDAPELFDCSSFTAYVFAQSGISIPRMSVDQFVYGEPIQESDARPGDLVFSNSGNGTIHYETKEWLKGTNVPEGIDHVGIYLGEGVVIHASRHNGSGSVDIEKLSESASFKTIVGFRRIRGVDSPRYVVTAPHYRLDIRIKEDLAEEIGRMYGYDKIPEALPGPAPVPATNKTLYYSEKIRSVLLSLGFSEAYTYSLSKKGAVEIANPIASDKNMLRKDLSTAIASSLEFNARNADLLGLDEVRMFEIGRTFGSEGERLSLCFGAVVAKNMKGRDALALSIVREAAAAIGERLGAVLSVPDAAVVEIDLDELIAHLLDAAAFEPFESGPDIVYRSVSAYPFVLRDIAVWVPESVAAEDVRSVIAEKSGQLLVRTRLFDTFTKEFPEGKRTSYAFRLVFQSNEKTLSDAEVNVIMNTVTETLNGNAGWEVR